MIFVIVINGKDINCLLLVLLYLNLDLCIYNLLRLIYLIIFISDFVINLFF